MAGATPNSVLAQNLDRLLTLKGLSRKEAAEAIGVPYKWLRRSASRGLGRADQGKADHLGWVIISCGSLEKPHHRRMFEHVYPSSVSNSSMIGVERSLLPFQPYLEQGVDDHLETILIDQLRDQILVDRVTGVCNL